MIPAHHQLPLLEVIIMATVHRRCYGLCIELFFKRKSKIKNVMRGLIKNLNTMKFRSGTYSAIMSEKMLILTGHANRKGCR